MHLFPPENIFKKIMAFYFCNKHAKKFHFFNSMLKKIQQQNTMKSCVPLKIWLQTKISIIIDYMFDQNRWRRHNTVSYKKGHTQGWLMFCFVYRESAWSFNCELTSSSNFNQTKTKFYWELENIVVRVFIFHLWCML